MRLEAGITGLTKAKVNKLPGVQSYDERTGLAHFEWVDGPHDYATAISEVRDHVAAAGGEVTSNRIVS